MKKQKAQQGITLIALIITIVVLLILAVVTINAVREGGIITHAQDAASDYTIAQEKEQIALAYSEYFMNKRTNPNATLKVEGATVSGSEESGWEVTFDKTNNAYEVDKDGKVEIAKEIVISKEKDITAIGYTYNTMYNKNQTEIISVSGRGYYDDTNKDGVCDINSSLGAYIYNTYFNIKNTFFEQDMPTEGNINAIITHLDGTVQDIILTKIEGDIAWEYEGESPLDDSDDGGKMRLYIGFRPNAEFESDSRKEEIDQYKDSDQYHYMYIEGEVVVPFQKLEMLGETLEFPFNCQANVICGNISTGTIEPMYKDINNVSKIIVNFSDNTKKVYTSENFFEYKSGRVYSSNDVPILYEEGIIYIHMQESTFKNPITSVIVEEGGVATKYNVTDTTVVLHTRPGS